MPARGFHDARRVCAQVGTRDVYRVLRAPTTLTAVPAAELAREVDRLRARLAANPAAGAVHPQFATVPSDAVVEDAVRGLGTYHTKPAVVRRGEDIVATDLKLVYYYQNRTAHLPQESSDAKAEGTAESGNGEPARAVGTAS